MKVTVMKLMAHLGTADLERAVCRRNEAEHLWLVAEQEKNRQFKAMFKALIAYQLSNPLHNDAEAHLFNVAHDVLKAQSCKGAAQWLDH